MDAIKKILLIRFSSIGDIVLTSLLVRVLRKRFPNAFIDFATKSEFAELLRYNPYLNTVIELTSGDWPELRSLGRRIRRERYDVVLDLHNSLRSRYLRLISGVSHVGVINKRLLARTMLVKSGINYYRDAIPVAERYLEAASSLGLQNDGAGLELFLPEEASGKAAHFITSHFPEDDSPILALAPAAKHKTKMWPSERFADVAKSLVNELGARILLVGGAEDSHICVSVAHQVNDATSSGSAVSVAGSLSLLETAAVLDRCDLVLTNDSAIMHIAAARHRPVVAIFGPTVREFGFFPYGTISDVLEKRELSCRPCTHIGSDACPKRHFRCMLDISIDDVYAAVKKMISEQQAAV